MRYLLILLFLCSCASAKKKAIELCEKGQHEAAIAFWAEALLKDPEDEEVQNGMQASLDVISNDRLTRIRDKRLANNMQESLEEMKSLVDLQKKYKIKLDFNSSSFQGKEVQYLWPYNKFTIQSKIAKKMPLAAESDHKTYRDVFNSMKDYEVIQHGINKSGKEKCLSLKKTTGQRPFFKSYITQFCNYFSDGRDAAHTAISSILYSNATLIADIDNINETVAGTLHSSFDKNLKETPWYHPESKRDVLAKVKGEYDWKPSSEQIQQAHNYTERVSYTVYEIVKKTRQVSYDTYVSGVRTTEYRTESYQEKEPVTKYKNVDKVYEYWATKKTLQISLHINGSITVDNKSYPFFFQKNVHEEKTLHDINLPSIGLYPQKEDVSNPMTKFKEIGNEMALLFKKDLNAIWEKNFCTMPAARDFASVAENVTKCRKLEVYPVNFVDSWFENNFGVKAFRAQEIIGQF